MKLKIAIVAILALIFSFAFVACGKGAETSGGEDKKDDPVIDKDEPVVEKDYVVLSYDEFVVKSKEFLTFTNYMSMIGADLSIESGDISVEASVDISVIEDVTLKLALDLGGSGLSVYVGGAKLYVALREGEVEQKDSMGFDNDLTAIVKEIGKDDTYIDIFEYFISDIGSRIDMSEIDFGEWEDALSKCSILYTDGENSDEYKLLANVSYDGTTYDSVLAGTMDVRFTVSGGCITSLSGSCTIDGKDTTVSFKRRNINSPDIVAPTDPESYDGTLLDEFEELYRYRTVTMSDFQGGWTSVDSGYSLFIGDEIKLVTSDGEITLVVESRLSNYLVLTSGDKTYIVRLTENLTVVFPDDTVVVFEKDDEPSA